MQKLIDNLRLSHKFLLVGLLALAMLALPMWRVVSDGWSSMAQSQAALRGVDPSVRVAHTVQLMQQHRGQSANFLSGNASAAAARAALEASSGKALQEQLDAAERFGDAVLTARVRTVQKDWTQLAQAVGQRGLSTAESFQRQSAVIAEQLDIIRGFVDRSGLALYPNASGYYLVMAALDHLPRLSESLGQARAVGVTLLNGGQADPGGQARVAGLVEAAYSAERHAQAALVLAMADSVDAKAALAAPAEQAHKAAQAGLALVESKIVQAAALDMPSKEYFGALTAQIDAQIALLDKAMQVMSAEVAGRVASVRNQLLLICALSGILAAIAAAMLVLVTRGTTRAAGLALGLARSIAEGDLSREMPPAGKDEMGQMLAALATMNASLHGIVGAVRSSSETIATGASQVAAGSLDLSQRTEEQASNLEQTAASMEQLSSTVQSNADVARQAAQLAGSASEVAARGGAVVSEVVSTMAEINTASRRIGDIIGVIDGIAFQTNILALNAAVEAARAGEQGRGFAVVASEVRSLAGRSANAAKEIKALIMDSVQKVDAGGQLVQQAGVTIGEIVAQVQQVTQLISGISQATAEQTLGIAQMSAAVDQLDQVTQQNAALVEESSAAADSLSEHAGQLLAAVRVFKLGTGEDRAPVAARVRVLR